MVFNTFTKIILTPIYYIIHHNYLFGFIHKFFIKNFYYNNLTFELKVKDIPLQNYASFLFKTYEYNDRKLIENHISKKNRAIILGGGLGFIPGGCKARPFLVRVFFFVGRQLAKRDPKFLRQKGESIFLSELC